MIRMIKRALVLISYAYLSLHFESTQSLSISGYYDLLKWDDVAQARLMSQHQQLLVDLQQYRDKEYAIVGHLMFIRLRGVNSCSLKTEICVGLVVKLSNGADQAISTCLGDRIYLNDVRINFLGLEFMLIESRHADIPVSSFLVSKPVSSFLVSKDEIFTDRTTLFPEHNCYSG